MHSLNRKEPWLAVNLSMFLAGVGQLYTGDTVKGWLFILFQIVGASVGLWLISNPTGNTLIGIIFIVFTVILGIWSLFDAYRSAVRRNEPNFEVNRKSNKDPWKAVFFSRIIPGIGHIYIGEKLLGILLIIIWLILTFTLPAIIVIILPAIAYHAYFKSPIKREQSKRTIFVIACLLILVPLLINPAVIRNSLFEVRYIAGESMLPTLQKSDRLIVDKWHSHQQAIQRQDIIVYKVPDNAIAQFPHISNDVFVHRVIGLPGDKLAVKQGKVLINNRPLQENYILEPIKYEFEPITVSANSLFVLGDNRNNSLDSHIYGVVPQANIIGKVNKIFYPFARSKALQVKN